MRVLVPIVRQVALDVKVTKFSHHSSSSKAEHCSEKVFNFIKVERTFNPGTRKRIDFAVKETTISLAFPVIDFDSIDAAVLASNGADANVPAAAVYGARRRALEKLPIQLVFAFLPVRRYSLRFALQADWVTPPSRENIEVTDDWNLWLVSLVPQVFIDAKHAFCGAHIAPEKVCRNMSAYVSAIPNENQVYELFHDAARDITQRLQYEAICPIRRPVGETGEPSTGVVEAVLSCYQNGKSLPEELGLVVPAKAVSVPRAFATQIAELVPPALLLEAREEYFLQDEFAQSTPKAPLECLQVQEFGTRHLVAVMEYICSGWQAAPNSVPRATLSKWIRKCLLLFDSLARKESMGIDAKLRETFERLQNVPCIPAKSCVGKESTLLAPSHPQLYLPAAKLAPELQQYKFTSALFCVDVRRTDAAFSRDEQVRAASASWLAFAATLLRAFSLTLLFCSVCCRHASTTYSLCF